MSADDLPTTTANTTNTTPPEADTKAIRPDNDLGAAKIADKRMGKILQGAETQHVKLPNGVTVLVITFFRGPLDADMIRGRRSEFAKQSKLAAKGGEDEKEADKAFNDAVKVCEAMLESGEVYLDRFYKHGAGTGRSTFFPALGQSQSLGAKQRAFANGLRMDAEKNKWMVGLPGMEPHVFDVAADDVEAKEEHAKAQGTAVATARLLRDLAGKDLRALVKEAEALVRELHKADPAALVHFGLKPFRTKAGDPARLTPKQPLVVAEDGKGKRGKA